MKDSTSVYRAMHRGAIVGLLLCLALVMALGGPPNLALWLAPLGAGAGAVTGLLHWLGVNDFDEQVIAPPRPQAWRLQAFPGGRQGRARPGWHFSPASRPGASRRHRRFPADGG